MIVVKQAAKSTRSREEMDAIRAVARNIRARREELGLKQSQVAQRIGVKQPSYQVLESGTVDIRTTTLKRLAKALKTTMADLAAE